MNKKKAAKTIFEAAIKAIDPYLGVKNQLPGIRETYEEMGFERLYVVAFGKAAFGMCRAVEEELGDFITEGMAITKYGHGGKLDKIKIFEASHPLPDQNGLEASNRLIDLLKSANEKTFILCLISGGGSSLLVSPDEHITLEDKQKTTDLLLKAGAEINDLNCVRKHLSRVKGGRLAEIAASASVVALILSDVIGDPLDVIASGPTSPDPTSFKEALDIIEKHNIKDVTPPAVLNLLSAGNIGMVEETPNPESEIFMRVKNCIIGNNRIALDAAKRRAEELGFDTVMRSSTVTGEAREVGLEMAGFAMEVSRGKGPKTLCYISGGETTVSVRGKGKGGRNMELALAFAEKIKGEDGITLLSAGTDGTDGPTDAAGAIVDGSTVPDVAADGFDAGEYLEENDSYTYFKKAGGLLITGPTGTNVMDIQILLID